MRKVLVTGAAGFIGSYVAERLLARGDIVCGVDDLNGYYDPALKRARLERLYPFSQFRFTKLGIEDGNALMALFSAERFDGVVHLAAQAGVRYSIDHPQVYGASNLIGFLNVLECCRRHPVAHLVYASSSSVYGANTSLPYAVGQSVDHPISLYAATKKSNEVMAHAYSWLFRIPTTGLRFFTVYGPWGRPDMAYFSFARAIFEGRPIEVFNEGRMERDFTYIDDVVEGVVRTLDQPASPDPNWDPRRPDPATSAAPFRLYNIGNHSPVSLLTFVDEIASAVGRPAIKVMKPMQPGDVTATFADVSALQHAVGFAPATPLRQGIERFVSWYREYYHA